MAHYRKDGGLDMRYSSSRSSMSSSSTPSYSSYSHSSTPASSGLHYRKDGGLDMRYNSSQACASSSVPYQTGLAASSDLHYRKDGGLDMRYNSSQAYGSYSNPSQKASDTSSDLHYRKDGGLDLRYNSSKDIISSDLAKEIQKIKLKSVGSAANGIPADVPKTKRGLPDMRTTRGKEWVNEQILKSPAGKVPEWLPKRKDGTLDTRLPVTKAFADQHLATEAARPRFDWYYPNKYEINEDFRRAVDSIRAAPVEIQQCPRSFDVVKPTQTGNIDEKLVIAYEELNIGKELGNGAFGVVYEAKWNGKEVAVKKLHLTKIAKNVVKNFINEIRVMESLRDHPNIVRLLGYTKDPLAIVMEFVELGSLDFVLHNCEDPDVEAKIQDGRYKKRIAVDIINGMVQLHRNDILHRDLKPHNVLLKSDFVAKITDFGFAVVRGMTMSSQNSSAAGAVGTVAYMAPELLDIATSAKKDSDVYSFGILLNELVSEEQPYFEKYQNFVGRGANAAAEYARTGCRPNLSSRTPDPMKKIIEMCWSVNPAARPTFQDLQKSFNDKNLVIPDGF